MKLDWDTREGASTEATICIAETVRPLAAGVGAAFGGAIAAHHVVSNARYAMVLDVGTRWREVYPSAETDAMEARYVHRAVFHIENVPARRSLGTHQGCDGMGMCPSTSRPYVS